MCVCIYLFEGELGVFISASTPYVMIVYSESEGVGGWMGQNNR